MHKLFDIFYDEPNKVYQIRTKSNVFVIEFPDPIEEKIFRSIVKAYEKQDFFSYTLLCKELKDFPENKILDVIQELTSSGILNLDNFEPETSSVSSNDYYSNCGWEGLTKDITTFRICFVGHETLGELMKSNSKRFSFNLFDVVEINPLSVIDDDTLIKIIDTHDFIIMDSSYWNPRFMSEFNNLMIDRNKPWLHVAGMIDNYNYSIGPIFHGKETGCYECVDKRNLSNDINARFTVSYRKFLDESNKFSKNISAPQGVEEIIANMIFMDINRYIAGSGIPVMWKHSLLYNCYNFTVSKHYVLKNPMCHTCNPTLNFSTSPWIDGIIAD